MADNTNLHAAKVAKNDEFYTQIHDIENEINHYKDFFYDKVVFCNCDDPYESNFFKYFANNFNEFHLRKLIATCYNGSPVSGNELLLDFGDNVSDPKKIAYKVEITEVRDFNGDGSEDLADVRYLMQNDKNVISVLKGNGDFRSPECIDLLKEADVVVTNPPFSLFRDYVAHLVKYDKKFIILGNMNAVTYKEIFSLIKTNKMWIGYGFNLSMVFRTTYPNLLEANRKYVRSKGFDPDKNYVKTPAIAWCTSIDITKRDEEMILYKHYNAEEYPTYENYNAININKVTDIPCDYDGVMGVPITFLDKYNPAQFDIIWRGGDIEWAENECSFYTPPTADRANRFKKADRTWRIQNPYLVDKNDNAVAVYQRIFIRRKK